MPCDYIWLQREKRYMKKKKKRKRKRGWEHFLLLIPLSSPVVSPRAGEEGRSRRSGQGAGGREAPPRRSPTQGDGPFLTSLLQEKRRPASPRPRIKQPLWSARPPVSVLMEIRACLPATLSARMQSWSAFPAGTADDNDVLKGSWAFIVYSPFSAFLFFFLSFFFFFPPDRALFLPTCWIWRSASFSARCSAPFTRRVLRAASARRRLTPWSASRETCGASRPGSPDTPGICS